MCGVCDSFFVDGTSGLTILNFAVSSYSHTRPAFVHRAHSGPFGLVNSEEGYQNLVRFLFGDIRFEVSLAPMTIERDLPNLNQGEAIEFLEINVDVAIRGLPTYLNTRRDIDNSSIIVRMRRGAGGKYVQEESGKETHLFTGFLRKPRTSNWPCSRPRP